MLRRVLLTVALAQLSCAASALADITSASLEIQGAGLRVETVSVTTGLDIPTTIQTSFGGKTNDEAPAVNGLLAVGELTGPGIDVPIRLETTPGYRFHIPGLSRLGEYYLQNIRLVNGNDVVQVAAPSLAKITVADLLQTSLQVRQLTPEEIRARGIVVDARNYDVYEYSFTFLVDGHEVVVPFPVISDRRTHVITPVIEEKDYGLPVPVNNIQPPRWSPPDIIPFEFPDLEAEELPDPGTAPPEQKVRPPRPRIPAALVIPNSLAVLHQFFAVVLTVTNGAPAGSTARLEDVAATMKIKVPAALRAVKSTPSVAFGQPVPVVDPNTGVTVLVAQAKGEAEWVLEGLKPGTHTVEVDIRATLREQGQDDVFLRATPSASVIIHDPRFSITFSHPDTVRKGLDYSTYTFITNMSPSAQTLRVADGLPQCTADQTPNVCRVSGGPPPGDMTLAPGEMRVVEYRLRAGETGQVYATAGTVNDDTITAAVQLHMGVSATGIPLSPATLVLPYYAQFLSPDLVGDYLQLLGLGYSLATAPVNQTTAKFPRVIKTDVFYRANDLARAGQRIFIGDGTAKRNALANLFLDLLGNGVELREWDELRRLEDAGRTAGAAVAKELRGALTGMETAIDELAAETAHRGNYVVALAHASTPLTIALGGASGRELPFADINDFDTADRKGALATVGRWTEDLEVIVTPSVTGPFELELLYPGTGDGTTMRARLVIAGEANTPVRIPITRGAATITANGSTGIGTAVTPPPVTILGARQDLHLDKEGHKVSVLFSRPVAFDGDVLAKFSAAIDFNHDGVVFTDARPIFAAALQQDQRVVNLSFDHVLSTNAGYTIDVASFGQVIPKIDNDRPAGILYGKFLTGDNKPIPGAEIKFFTGHHVGCIRYEGDEQQIEGGIACNPFAEAPQYAKTRADGSFLFEYVPRDVIADPGLTGLYKAVGVTNEGRATAVEGAVRLPGRVHIANLQLLGRGSAEGHVKFDDGTIAAGVRVHVSSTLFNVGRDATTDANGFFRVDDLAVGPITFGAVDAAGNVAFASGEIATPGQVAVKDLVIHRKPFPGTGTVFGRVTRSDTGAPVFGARVGVYSQGYGFAEATTDSEGKFEFAKVPAGFVTLLAAEWSISRDNAAADFDLRADETKEMNLVLGVIPSDMKFVRVTGRVVRENPLYPGDPSKYERVAGALVNLAILSTTADANGEFAFDDVPIVAGDPGNPKTIRAYDPSTRRIARTTVPTLTEAGPNDVTVFIPASSYGGGTIRVRVVNAAGATVDGFRVIEPGFPPKALVRIGAGLYEYRDAPIGSLIEIRAVDGPAAYGEQVAGGAMRLEFPGQTATMILRLPGQGTVRAKLRADFDLIGDVSLTYSVWSEAEQTMEALTVTQSTGENGIAGFATFPNVPALQQFHVESGHPVYGYADQHGQLAYEGDLAIHTLQLNKLATVRGTVYAIDGLTPVAGAAVRLYDDRRDAGIVYTQPDGTFVFHDVPAAIDFRVTADVTQSGIYRTGIAFGRTPDIGGPAPPVSIILKRRGSVEGRVVYADDTPDDDSDNPPVPLARFWLRELDYPERSFGTSAEPLVADINGNFAVSNVFVGSLRAFGWAVDNQELRGNWTGALSEEGEIVTGVTIVVGAGGTGSLQVKVVDPNQQYLPIANAEVRLYRGGLFDLTTTDDAGLARFDELPVGDYGVDAYSKSLGKSGAGSGVTIAKDQLSETRILLEFVGKVDGRLTDPMIVPAKPLPGVPVKLTASSFYALASTDAAGLFAFEGIREGPFQLEAKDTESNRWATAKGVVTRENRRPYIELELERTDTLHVAVYLPDDFGNDSGTLAGPFEMEVTQRCIGGPCDYRRALQGNPLAFPGLFVSGRFGGVEGYAVSMREIGGAGRTIGAGGAFPKGTAADPLRVVYPAFGGAEVTVMQAGVPAQGARVEFVQGNERRSVFTDASGKASTHGFRLGNVTAWATSVDGRFTGSATITIARQSVPGLGTIDLGAYAGVTGLVIAESGGPSIGTRALASFAGRTLEIATDPNGAYTFQGIPTSASGTSVELTYVGPDGVTIGARRSVVLKNEWASRVMNLDPVTLDATPPQLVNITPADGAQNVSPDAPVRLVFSEAIEPADLNANNLQLVAADGSGNVAATIEPSMHDSQQIVLLRPTQLLRSNTLYRIIVQASLRDRTGHRLPAPRGFTFTTADYAEPRVVKLVPRNDLPLPAQVTLQWHFNEPVATDGFTFHFYRVGAGLTEKAGRAYVDPVNGLYLAFAPDAEIEPESFYRATFSGIRDLQGNALAPQSFDYFSFDNTKPTLRLISPVPDGVSLVSGVEYTLNVDVPNDVAKVEYVRVDGASETFLTTVTAAPFAYRFVGPEVAEYTIRARATDTSGNESDPATMTWTVKPNAAPANVNVALTPASAYPGASVTANVTFEDEGVLAPVQVILRATKLDGTEYVKSEVLEARRNNVGEAWPPVALNFALPVTLKPETTATFTATVTDVRGLSASSASTVALLTDTTKPVIVSTTPAPETTYALNNKYTVTANVTDGETGVAEVFFFVDGVSHRVTASTNGVFTSPQITAGARNVDTRIPIVVRAVDYHGNAATREFDVIYIGVNDPTAPSGTWLCPVDRAVIPASQIAFKLPLKVRAIDDVSVTSVKFRVPGIADITAARIGTSDEYEALATFDTPVEGTDFAITAVISDADATHTIELPIHIDVVAVDRIIDATEAVDADTVQLYEGKSLLVRAPGKLVVNVPLAVRNLLVLDGGKLETLGTTLTRERKLDLTVSDRFYLDCASTIDVTAKGYLGGWGVNPDGTGTRSDTAMGRTFGNVPAGGATGAGASHGGHGGAHPTGTTNAPYGSYTDPLELGSGGAGHPTATHNYGGTGGGAVSLRTSDANDALARIVVAGTIRADGGGGLDEFRGRHGGSGGSVRIHARQVVVGPLAQVSANGGRGEDGCDDGNCFGGSGGRIAVTATERLDLDTPLGQLRAFGGSNGSATTGLHGAAGTIYLRRPGQTGGELWLADERDTRATPLDGGTFDRIVLGPFALARFDGDVVGPIERDPTARLVPFGAVPAFSVATTPANGASIIRNQPLEVLLDASTPGGILRVDTTSSAAPPLRVSTFAGYPVSVDDHRLVFTVPPDAPLGSATLTVKVVDRSDRVTERVVANFTIVDDTAPVLDSFTALPASLYPGSSVTATINAHDDVGITRVSATPSIGAAQTRTPNTKIASESFTFAIPVDTPGGTPMTIEASVEDAFPGHVATKQTASVTILNDTNAPQATITAPANDQLFDEATGTFTVTVDATDAEVRVRTVTASIDNGTPVALTAGGNSWQGTLAIPAVDGADIVSFPVTVVATDYAGNAKTVSITIRVKPTVDPNAPIVQWTCAREATVVAGAPVRLRVEARPANAQSPVQSVQFAIGAQTLSATSIGNDLWEATWTVPAGAATHLVSATATSTGGASITTRTNVTAVVADQLFSADATISDATYDNKVIAVTAGTLTITGAHTFAGLYVLGGTVTHPSADASFAVTTGTLYVACGAAIDATAKGYTSNNTYQGATTPFAYTGGSHIGRGRNFGAGSTFGSVHRPLELGGSAFSSGAGGGVLRIRATDLMVDGAIRVNGESVHRSGAGGSIWITTNRIRGNGSLEARGGAAGHVAGGGGAIAVEYTDSTSVMPRLVMHGGTSTAVGESLYGGSGTAFLFGPASTFGDLVIDTGTNLSDVTELPSLGGGTAQPGSGGATLVTTRDIPLYFIGHSVEIAGKGTFRIANIAAKTITLEAGANVAAGDAWQGVYRFDNLRTNGTSILESLDPIRIAANAQLNGDTTFRTAIDAPAVTIDGRIAAQRVDATAITINAAGTLTHESRQKLDITTGTLTVDGAIDVTAKGYRSNDTWPGATVPFAYVGGSHIGRGRGFGTGSTFGSVYRPDEHGGSANDSGAGGGVVRIRANDITVNGAIRANGESVHRSGAGGSIRITTGLIRGSGPLEARGGSAGHVAGGGGAIALEYTDPASGLPIVVRGGSSSGDPNLSGGAGAYWLFGPASTFGDLTIDETGVNSFITELPSLGGGIAQPGTSGTTLVADRTLAAYFAGHFVEIAGKGIWRITGVGATTITLETGATAATGDVWQGIYRVDKLTLRNAQVQSADPIRYATLDKDPASTLTMNASAPQFANTAQIAVGGDFVTGPAGAVSDPDAPIVLTATNTRTGQAFTANAAANGSFSIPIGAAPGDTFTLRATDSHAYPLTSAPIAVNGAFIETATIASFTIEPSTVAGGTTAFGSIRLAAPARMGGITVSLTSSNGAASVSSLTIPAGSTAAQFAISTTSVAAQTNATITATLANAKTATLTINPPSTSITSLTLSSPATEGGVSVDATVTLGSAAPPGGATVLVSASSPLVIVPSAVVVPEGATQKNFTVASARVSATSSGTISATYGATRSAALTLTACSAMPTAAPPASLPLTTNWVDDAPPANATVTGAAAFDDTQAASGTLSLHFTASTATRSWSFSGATPMSVTATDNLVLYALVNPCNPPRQILVSFSDGTNEWSGSWGESRIAPLATNVTGAVPSGGVWTRLEMPAPTANVNKLTISVDRGEVWFDAIGSASCALARQPAPTFNANEMVWFDDTLPAGAVVVSGPFVPDTSQVGSGSSSDRVAASGHREHAFTGATDPLTLSMSDMIVVNLLIDPCNPPREVMVRFHDGNAWSRNAYWGENLIDTGYHHFTEQDPFGVEVYSVTRRRMGALPEAGKWVRLEIPVSSMQMAGMTVRGIAFTLFDGQAWFDRVAKVSRINLALGKPAAQSSTVVSVTNAVDGDVTNFHQTNSTAEAWWEVDLGAVQPIDAIDVWNGGPCCPDRLQNFWVLVSDEPFASTSLTAARNQAGVSAYYTHHRAWSPSTFEVARTGRYVRVQLAGSNFLHAAEVQVWAPVSRTPVNLAGGRNASQSSTHNDEIANKAVNGSSMGFTWSHTTTEPGAWWQVDLGSVQWIGTVDVDNTSACCGNRMADFYLYVSDVPLTSDTLNQAGVSAYYRGPWRSAYTYSVNRSGRYLRLQLTGTNPIHPFEVKVWSPFLTLPPLAKSEATR